VKNYGFVIQILWLKLQRFFFHNGLGESGANLYQALCSYFGRNLSKFECFMLLVSSSYFGHLASFPWCDTMLANVGLKQCHVLSQ
jgi:hypothetical protein